MDCRNLPVRDSRATKLDLNLYLLAMLSMLATCSCSARAIGQPDLGKLYDRALGAVSVGMPVEDAKIQLEKLGFTCELVENGTIMYTDKTHPNITTIRNVRFLQCIVRSRTVVGQSALNIQLLVEDGKVKQIYKLFSHVSV